MGGRFFGSSIVGAVAGLYLVEGFLIYHGFTILLDYLVSKVELANVETVAEEAGVGGEGAEKVGGFLDLAVGAAGSAHLPGFFDKWGDFWIWDPAVDDVG
jgi:hypothetical protein